MAIQSGHPTTPIPLKRYYQSTPLPNRQGAKINLANAAEQIREPNFAVQGDCAIRTARRLQRQRSVLLQTTLRCRRRAVLAVHDLCGRQAYQPIQNAVPNAESQTRTRTTRSSWEQWLL